MATVVIVSKLMSLLIEMVKETDANEDGRNAVCLFVSPRLPSMSLNAHEGYNDASQQALANIIFSTYNLKNLTVCCTTTTTTASLEATVVCKCDIV